MFPPQAVAPQMHQPPQQMQGAPRPSRGKWYALGGVVVIGAIVVIAVVASGGKKKADPHKIWIETLESTRDALCACKDDGCVRVALDNLGTVEHALGSDAKGEQDDEEVHKHMGEIKKCLDKVAHGDKPHNAPADEDAFKDVMLDLRDLRDKMCKCPGSKDPYCAAQYKAEYESAMPKWKKMLGDTKLGADDEKMLKQGIMELLACEEAAKKGGN